MGDEQCMARAADEIYNVETGIARRRTEIGDAHHVGCGHTGAVACQRLERAAKQWAGQDRRTVANRSQGRCRQVDREKAATGQHRAPRDRLAERQVDFQRHTPTIWRSRHFLSTYVGTLIVGGRSLLKTGP